MSCEKLISGLGAEALKDCFDHSTAATEKGKRFSFDNRSKKQVCRIKVDGCLINDSSVRKCDYLFKVNETEKYYLVELKGEDISHAVNQVVDTFVTVNKKLQTAPDKYQGVIVSSAVPAATQLSFRMLQEKCYKNHKLAITRRSNGYTERI